MVYIFPNLPILSKNHGKISRHFCIFPQIEQKLYILRKKVSNWQKKIHFEKNVGN